MLPLASRAVKVRMLAPTFSGRAVTIHRVVPPAVPLPPRLFVQVTCVTAASSLALPPTSIVAFVVVTVVVVGWMRAIVGDFESGTVKSRAPLQGPGPEAFEARTDHDARPAASTTAGAT